MWIVFVNGLAAAQFTSWNRAAEYYCDTLMTWAVVADEHDGTTGQPEGWEISLAEEGSFNLTSGEPAACQVGESSQIDVLALHLIRTGQ